MNRALFDLVNTAALIIVLITAVGGRAFGEDIGAKQVERMVKLKAMREIEVDAQEMRSEVLKRCFKAKLYWVEVEMGDLDGGSSTTTMPFAESNGALASIKLPSVGGERIEHLPRIIDPAFTLKTEADGEIFREALDHLYFKNRPSWQDKVELRVVQKGLKWHFIDGDFFDKLKAITIETDADGKILSAIRDLGLVVAE